MRFPRVLGAIVLTVLAIGLAGAIFQTGYLAGAGADGVVDMPVRAWHAFGWGFGGGLFHLLGFLFFIVLFVSLLRLAFGGGRGHGGHGWGPGPRGWDHDGSRYGRWEDRAREVHDEWHRRQGDGGGASTAGSTGSSGAAGTTPPTSGPSAG